MFFHRSASRLCPLLLAMTIGATQAAEPAALEGVLGKTLAILSSEKDAVFAYEDGKVTAGGKQVEIAAVSEPVPDGDGKRISAARFEVSIDGVKHPELTFGSVGTGDSPQEAAQSVVHEWFLHSGAALLSAIGGKPTNLRSPGYKVYAGSMGMRGKAPQDWLDGSVAMKQRLLAALAPHFPKRGTYSAVDLKIVVMPDGSLQGQCLIDGQESAAILEDLKKLPWPASESSYLFKQAYVGSKATKAQPTEAPKAEP